MPGTIRGSSRSPLGAMAMLPRCLSTVSAMACRGRLPYREPPARPYPTRWLRPVTCRPDRAWQRSIGVRWSGIPAPANRPRTARASGPGGAFATGLCGISSVGGWMGPRWPPSWACCGRAYATASRWVWRSAARWSRWWPCPSRRRVLPCRWPHWWRSEPTGGSGIGRDGRTGLDPAGQRSRLRHQTGRLPAAPQGFWPHHGTNRLAPR